MAYNQGGIKPVEGAQPPTTSAIEEITLQNYDSNPARVNTPQNQNTFLSLTGHKLSANFKAKTLDFKFNDGAGTVGMNPFFQAPATATKIFTA